MTASVIYLEHALTPHKRRIEHVQPRSIKSLAPDWKRPFIAMIDGKAVLRADWTRTLHHGQTLAFIDVQAIPQGGNKGGSNPIAMLLSLAVMVFAPYLSGMLSTAGMSGTFLVGNFTLANALTMGIQFAGLAIVNALVAPPKPTTNQQANSLAAPSPTYNLQAQGNSARLEAAIPEQFGRHLAYPDYAAQPYAEFIANDQYLYQLFCIGRGEYDIEAIRIEDTPLASFNEITYEVVKPGHPCTLFPSNVTTAVEVSGQDLPCIAGTYSQSGTTEIKVVAANHNLNIGSSIYLKFTSGTATSGDYTVTATEDAGKFSVTAGSSATTSGSCEVSTWIGPFTANSVNAQMLSADFAMMRGMFYAPAGVPTTVSIQVIVECRVVNQSGLPISSWMTLLNRTYSGATTTAQRYTERVGVASYLYQVRARRVDVEQTDTTYGHDVVWAGMRAFLPEVGSYGDVTLIAMKMLATNSLSSQSSRKVNVIATRKLPTWNGTTWSAPTATRSIAWALAYACKSVGLTDAQIDLPTLLALNTTWTTRGDNFDARFDNFLSFWEAITKIASAGRAKAYMQAGIVRVMRDQAATIPVQVYSMRNIARGSFGVDYLMPTADTADAIDVGYFDSASWKPMRVRAMFSDSTAQRPAKVELFGVTSKAHALREGMYQAASNRLRRKIIKFSTEMEGFIPSFGDLIAIQHDMPAWGQGGEVIEWNAATLTATLSEAPEWAATGTHYIGLRKRDGSMAGPYTVTRGATEFDVVLGATPSFTPYTGGDEERTHIVFGLGETYRQPARVIAIRPRSLTSVEIECINEDASVHTADSTGILPAVQYSQHAGRVNAPVINGYSVTATPGNASIALATWSESANASHYTVQRSNDGVTWATVGTTTQLQMSVPNATLGTTRLRVAAMGAAQGPWIQSLYGGSPDYMWSPDSSTLMWSPNATDLMWRY